MAISSINSSDNGKKAAGERAAEFVQEGMLVGLGTGSTAYYFIESLIKRCENGLKVKGLATSKRSHAQALEGGIPMLNADDVIHLDLAIDGADEIDPYKRMLKGGGGALLREKIIANMAKEMVVVVDESKCVEQLGAFPLAVEIEPFCFEATINALNKKGFEGKLRLFEAGKPYKTDNNHFIYDISFKKLIDDPEHDERVLKSIPGVIETGFFLNFARRVVIGRADGSVKVLL